MAKIKLRKITLDDTKKIVKWRNNSNVKKNFCYQEDLTVNIHEKWFKTRITTGEVIQFIIIDEEKNKEVGSTYLRDIDYKNKKAEFGIFIGEDDARGRGIGTESVKKTIKYGFQKLKLHKIMLRVFSNNTSAIRAYEKAGFNYEGTAKDDILLKNGLYQDIVFMSIINDNQKE